MRVAEVQVYQYDELATEAQEKARQWYLEGDMFESKDTIDNCKEILEHLGYRLDHIYWSGFGSQGDGACFVGQWYAEDVHIENMFVTEKMGFFPATLAHLHEKWPQAACHMAHRGHYSHEKSVSYDFTPWTDDDPDPLPSAEQVTDAETEFIKATEDAMRWVYGGLKEEYYHATSDEVVAENIRANEYEFTLNGKRF